MDDAPFRFRTGAALTAEYLLPRVVQVAAKSPCAKSKRGVVVFRSDGYVIGWGFNAQPAPFSCDGSEACRASCAMLCEHAEQAALRRAGHNALGAHLLHVKAVDGVAVPSGGPSCWQCSRAILAAGISTVWLLHEGGVRGYDATEFHRLTWEHVRPGLPLAEAQ